MFHKVTHKKVSSKFVDFYFVKISIFGQLLSKLAWPTIVGSKIKYCTEARLSPILTIVFNASFSSKIDKYLFLFVKIRHLEDSVRKKRNLSGKLREIPKIHQFFRGQPHTIFTTFSKYIFTGKSNCTKCLKYQFNTKNWFRNT